ncbi:hypothetical protein WJX84_006645 [Apatococcus fuscideae]|uniref:Uncharacterized protein n=1 Tax=Apatococcus fuscideae TaxID=2026836 RepID=A0AAW1T9P6_9CHLO
MPPKRRSGRQQCPICFDLLYKPCVNSCGHVSCFWCFHQCMSPYNASKCPLCRAAFVHFPGVCRVLHLYLSKAFPDEYEIRDQENRDDEARTNKHSPDLPTREDGMDDADLQIDDFKCSRVGCNRLLCKPVVLNCGHAVCRSCAPPPQQAGAEDSRPAVCSRCNNLALPNRSVCMQLDELVERLFPELYSERAQQLAEETSAAVACAAALEAATPKSAASTTLTPAMDIVLPSAAASEGSASAAGSPASSSSDRGPATDSSITPPSSAAAERPPDSGNHLRMSILRAIRDEHTFVHHGVGCDSCGICPVVGRCYHCQDCQDHVGFDLCSACHELGLHKTGRFNQQHTADHRMAVLKPVPNLWHILQAANPDLTIDQIMGMVDIAWQDNDREVQTAPRRLVVAPTRIGLAEVLEREVVSDSSDQSAFLQRHSSTGEHGRASSTGHMASPEQLEDEARQPLLPNSTRHQAHVTGIPADNMDLPASPIESHSGRAGAFSYGPQRSSFWHAPSMTNPAEHQTFSGGHIIPGMEDPSRELLVVEDDGTAVWHDAHEVPADPWSPTAART